MRITVTRTGGFAGIERRAELETTGRPDAEHLPALVEECFTAASPPPSSGVPDGFHYEITVGDRTVHCADPALSKAQRQLTALVLKEGR